LKTTAIAIARTDHSPEELRAMAAKSKDSAQARRLLAIAMAMDGVSRTEAAGRTGMDRQTLCDWAHRYNEEGPDGLVSRRGRKRPPKLDGAEMAEFRALAVAGPDPSVHKVVRWRCADLRDEVARRFSVEVNERTIGKWLRKLGLTRLQPRPFHPGKDAAAQEAFKKTSPPALPAPWRSGMPASRWRSGSRTKPG
jgi:transposase